MASTPDTIIIKLDPEAMAILERIAAALEALVRQQKSAPPASPAPGSGPFLGDT